MWVDIRYFFFHNFHREPTDRLLDSASTSHKMCVGVLVSTNHKLIKHKVDMEIEMIILFTSFSPESNFPYKSTAPLKSSAF